MLDLRLEALDLRQHGAQALLEPGCREHMPDSKRLHFTVLEQDRWNHGLRPDVEERQGSLRLLLLRKGGGRLTRRQATALESP